MYRALYGTRGLGKRLPPRDFAMGMWMGLWCAQNDYRLAKSFAGEPEKFV